MNLHRGLRDHWDSIAAASLALIVVAWIPAAYFVGSVEFRVLTPAAHVGLEAASAIARFFAALVLLLLPKTHYGRGVRWLAAGLVVLGIGSVTFGSLPYAFGYSIDMNDSVIGSLVVATVSGSLVVVGLVPERPPRLTWTLFLLAISSILIVKFITFTDIIWVPKLWMSHAMNVDPDDLTDALGGVTLWYWLLMPIPLLVSLPGLAAAFNHYRREKLPGWIFTALIFWTGAQLHNFYWPSTYNLVVTTTDVLRFLFAMIIVIAGIYSLHQSAQEYERLLDVEKRLHQQLAFNTVLKNDFTRMVAHELGSPVAAIRRYVEIAQIDPTPKMVNSSLEAIDQEVRAIGKLVSDIQAIATVESDDFSVNVRPVPIDRLIEEARVFSVTLALDHPFQLNRQAQGYVMADSARIGQVLRNLIDNAAKYSPRGTPIMMNVTENGRKVSFAIRDSGYGIPADEIDRLFNKYERGRHAGSSVPSGRGAGLGLYLSRQIVRAHGSEIWVDSRLGEGSTFRFTLEVAQ